LLKKYGNVFKSQGKNEQQSGQLAHPECFCAEN
jgi:hypothetical protein